MSIFKASKDCTVDDSVALTCTIESAYNLKDHTEYSLRVQSGCMPDHFHHVTKRYSDFAALDAILKGYGTDFLLPPKKIFGKMDSDFVEQRQLGLQNYLAQVLAHSWASRCLDVKVFLSPKTYLNLDLHETALQNVSMFLRSEDRWRASALLPHIGWRLRKCFLTAVDTSQPKEKYLLTWCMAGDDRSLDDRDLEQSMKILTSLRHPGIEPTLFATCNSSCTVVIRKYYEHGSVRDIICNAKPTVHFVKKYSRPKSFNIMPVNSIRLFGRQLLETLRFLYEKGFPYIHVHAGNVVVDGSNCRLLDVENALLGVSTFHRRAYLQLHKLNTIESLTVYCFGHLVYEMSTGKPLDTLHCDNISYTCPHELRSVLELTLSSAAIKSGLPTITDLLQHPFFSGVSLPPDFPGDPHLKIPSKLRERFKASQSDFEQRLRGEQSIIHQYRRLARAQAFHMSNEEKRRRRLQKMVVVGMFLFSFLLPQQYNLI